MSSFMWGKAVHDACEDFAREMGMKRTGPRYGIKATAEAANRLRAAVGKYPDDAELYSAADQVQRLLYNQSNWIMKVWTGLAQAAQEAER